MRLQWLRRAVFPPLYGQLLMNILHVDSSIMGEHSVSRKLTAAVVDRLVALTPGATVVYRDVASEPLPQIYGALYAAIGAMCNTIQETQQYAIFVTVFIIVGFFAVFALIKDPTGPLGVTMSYIPFFAPFTMPVRWSMTSVPPLELVVSLALMVVALLACVWLAARIYRTGILMYGKKPSWRELWRWIRA